jgi:Tol biopolymer transport system component
VARPDRPIQVTTNGSWDDHPAWDPAGAAIYFRSNRGGDWNIWKVATR